MNVAETTIDESKPTDQSDCCATEGASRPQGQAAASDAHAEQHADAKTPESEERESLYPLILIVGFITGVTALIAINTNDFTLSTMMRHFMAGFFIVFAFFKLLDLRGFVTAYQTYDIIAKRTKVWAWAYPFVELALGVAYLLALWPIVTNTVTLVIMLIGTVGVWQALTKKQQIRCACLGTALNLPMTTVTLVEDLGMAAMAAAMLAMHAL